MCRAVNNPQINVKLHFVQWTLEIPSEQTFAVYEKGPKKADRRLVAGDPNKIIQVSVQNACPSLFDPILWHPCDF